MIDFLAATRQFGAPLRAQTALMVPVFDKLAEAIGTLARQADAAERATRAYPVLRYRDGAVGVRLHVVDAARLLPDTAGLSLGAGLREGGARFLAGLALVPTSLEQDRALPRLVRTIDELLEVVDASLERHLVPTPALFRPGGVTTADVFGVANLAWSSLVGEANQAQLRAAGQGALASLDVVAVFRGPAAGAASPATTPEGAAPPAVPTGSAGGLGGLELLPADALLLLPLLIPAIDVVLTDGLLAAQRALVPAFSAEVEPHLRALRSHVVDAWSDAFELGTTVHFTIAAVELVTGANKLLLEWGFPGWFDGLLDGVAELGRGITIWGVYGHVLLRVFEAASDDLMGVDLVPWVARNLLPGWLSSRLSLPTLTVGDVVEFAAGHGHPAIRDALVEVLDKAGDVAWLVPGTGNLDDRIAAARDIADLVLTPTPFTHPPDVLPTGPLPGFPDVYEAFLGGGRRALLLDSVRRLGTGTGSGVLESLRAAQGLAVGAAELAAAEGERQARLGAGLHLPERERAQRALAGSLFAPLRSEAEARAAAATPDPLSTAFDAAVAGGGITAAAAAVPAYIGRLRDHWQARTEATVHPTSAHVLARRGRFAGVRMPRLTVRADGHPAGDSLADAIAARFRVAAADAYRDGRARMVAAQAEATARPRSRTRPTTSTGGGRRGR